MDRVAGVNEHQSIVLTPQRSRPKLGSFRNTCMAAVYFSPRPLSRFDLAVKAISIRRRIASERSAREMNSAPWRVCCLAEKPFYAKELDRSITA
jgi:hypothetical protein